MTLDRMKSGRLKLHVPEQVQRIAGLRRNPGMDLRGSIPDLAQVSINASDVSNHHAARSLVHTCGEIG
jgi:hypothetical protein